LTRPDIIFASNSLNRFQNEPSQDHYALVDGLLRYLENHSELGLSYGGPGATEALEVYSDATWASDAVDRRSVSGYVLLGAGVISYSCKRQ
jgi:hypothetical protein